MNKRKKQNDSQYTFASYSLRTKIIIVGVLISVGLLLFHAVTHFSGPARNAFLKITYSPQSGYAFVIQSPGSVKGMKSGAGISGSHSGINPTLYLNKGFPEAIHMINEDPTHSKHNFNVDEFNIHTNDIGYFQSQIVNFTPDKSGTFTYYCKNHPEMKGTVIVT